MTKVRGAEYLLDGYPTLGSPETITKNGIEYTVQRFQGKHKNEYLLRSPTGDVYLYENNVLKQKWQENENEERSEEFFALKNGRIDFRMRFDDILKQLNFNKIVNHKKGLRMEIWSSQTGNLKYHGEFNERRQKEGWGIEYDEESGKIALEGIWRKGILKEVIRVFDGDTMTELRRNGEESVDPVKRIPTYMGGFRYDEDAEMFFREGKGCLIDEKNGIAYRESEWKDGKELSGVDLYEGWYNLFPIRINETDHLATSMFPEMSDLLISSNCCNDLNTLDLSNLECLRSIEIGSECFESVQTFKIDGLRRLKSLKIGDNSFTRHKKQKGNDQSRSFHILNCESLISIDIGEYSFSDYSGEFELHNLISLESIQIGSIGNTSCNFYESSFVIQGINMM